MLYDIFTYKMTQISADSNYFIYLTSIRRGVLAQSSEPEAHDKVLDNLIQIKLEFGNVRFW